MILLRSGSALLSLSALQLSALFRAYCSNQLRHAKTGVVFLLFGNSQDCAASGG
jgi:hypothetical protein